MYICNNNCCSYTMNRLLQCLLALLPLMGTAHSAFRHLTVADGLPNNQLRQMVELPNGQIMVEAEGIFCLYNGKHFVPLTCNLDSVRRLPTFGCHSHLWQGDSLLWLKDYYSLYLFDVKARRFCYDYERNGQWPRLQQFISENGDSVTHARLRALEPQQKQFDSLVTNTALKGEQLQAWLRDRQGGLWFGTLNSGIVYQRPQCQTVKLITPEAGDAVRRMVSLDRHTLLTGSSKGICLFDCERGRVKQTLATGHINCAEMQRDQRGRVWIATAQGIYCYDHGTLLHYDHTNTTGFLHDQMRFVMPIDENRLLVCNFMHYLGIFHPDEHRMEMLGERIPELSDYRTMITSTLLSDRRRALVCTQNGCFILNLQTLQKEPMPGIREMERYCRKFNCVLLCSDGHLWLGTQNGLLMVDRDKVTRRITRAEGLSNDCIQSLAEDADGYLWIGTSNGMNRLRWNADTNCADIRTIGTDDGLPAVEMTERGICMASDSTLYLATVMGMVSIATGDFRDSAPPTNTVLTGLSVAGVDMPLDKHELQLNYRQNYIALKVSALNYAHPVQTLYRYRIVQSPLGWQVTTGDNGQMADIRLDALSPGTYTIEIQASLGDNVWGTPLRKTFVISPPLWLTWWAKTLYVLIALAVLAGAVREYLRRKRQKMLREQEQRVNQLFEVREQARRQFAQSVQVDPKSLAANAEEQQFIEHMVKIIGKNMDNSDYTVDLLARDIGMSRASLYKKMQTMLGITPSDFMRNVRLKHAATLLADSEMPVNQVALAVGFLTPRYFSQYFRKMFGVTPSEYRTGKQSSSPAASPQSPA